MPSAITPPAWGAAIVTKDEDFAIRRVLTEGPAVVWLRLGNTRRVVLLTHVEAAFPAILGALERGETLIEVVLTRFRRRLRPALAAAT